MDERNIALVRATNIIPFEGVVKPISEVPYIKKITTTRFAFAISDLLRKVGILSKTSFNPTKEERDEIHRIINQYVPYMSNYNSMSLWALNGLVPDDNEKGFGNNIFSNKKCVIIDGLAEQLKLSNVVSLVPTDTAIRGNVKLSKSAIILIEKTEYESLSEEQKNKLNNLNLTVKTFSGDLRETVEKALLETGRYIPERPTLSGSDGGYKKSSTSDELIQTINTVAIKNKILQKFHMDVLFSTNRKSLGELQNEYDNIMIVNSFYERQFFEFLCRKIPTLDKRFLNRLLSYPDYYIKELCKRIEEYGIDNYKALVEEYNKILENLEIKGELYTPQQIVDLVHKGQNNDEKNIDLNIDLDI